MPLSLAYDEGLRMPADGRSATHGGQCATPGQTELLCLHCRRPAPVTVGQVPLCSRACALALAGITGRLINLLTGEAAV